MTGGDRRLAAVMFTDMVGYTALGQRNESLSLALLEEQRKLVRPILARHKGREVKTIGDAFLVEFPNAVEAVRCAYDIQRATREFNFSLEPEKRIHLRVGVHVGEVVESQGDISGDAVNVASRIEPLAEDGGVCISHRVYDLVHTMVDLQLAALGRRSLKNVAEPMEVYKVVMPWEKEVASPEGELPTKRVAILPLVNMSPDPQDEFFADGLTEELIDKLSQVRELVVVARTSVMSFKKKEKKASEIGRELRAGALVEGSIRKSGNRIRVTAQLINTNTEGHLWSSSYDRTLDDVFAVQTDIAEKVTDALKVQLLPEEKDALEVRATANTDAYLLYLKGRYQWNKRSREGLTKAIELYENAVAKDSSFALGYSGLAECYMVMARNHMAPSLPTLQRAKVYVTKALELDEGLAEAHAVLGSLLADYESNFEAAEVEYKRAIQLNPSYASAHQWYAIVLGEQGRLEESEREVRKAVELDPLSLPANTNLGDCLYYQGRLDESIEQLRRTLEIEPNFYAARASLFDPLVRKGMFDDALKEAEIISKGEGSPIFEKYARAYVEGFKGHREESLSLISEVERDYLKENFSPYQASLVHFVAGDIDGGFHWLNKAYDEHDGWVHAMAIDFEFDSVRGDPRYLDLLRKVGLGNTLPRA